MQKESVKILFLDVDGCLNYLSKTPEDQDKYERYSYEWLATDVWPELVERLNTIIIETGAKTVLSSSWRKVLSIEEMTSILKSKGFISEVIDKTEARLSYVDRGREIRWWLENCNFDVERFVILDDNYYPGFNNPQLIDNIVHIVESEGLQDEHVLQAIKILNS